MQSYHISDRQTCVRGRPFRWLVFKRADHFKRAPYLLSDNDNLPCRFGLFLAVRFSVDSPCRMALPFHGDNDDRHKN